MEILIAAAVFGLAFVLIGVRFLLTGKRFEKKCCGAVKDGCCQDSE